MKQLYTLLAAFLLTASALLPLEVSAEAPEKKSYQALVRDGGNALVTDQGVGLHLSILQGYLAGIAVYVETQSPTTNINGLVSIEIGSGTTVSGSFSSIDRSNAPYFIKTETDPTVTLSNGGSTLEDSAGVYTAGTGIDITNNVISTSGTCGLSIGDTCEGGIVFYLDDSGCHGLVAKATDELGFYKWYSISFNTWTFESKTFDGAQKTKKSVALDSNNSSTCPAASICENLISGGYTDWYLPSKDELDMMYMNLHVQNLGGFATYYYWSSSEIDNDYAWFQNFLNGIQNFTNEAKFFYVRAVRAF
jgi:hypothetical protein